MVYTPLTKKAMQIAYTAHHGQVDKGGMPYICHPLHLAESMEDEISVTVIATGFDEGLETRAITGRDTGIKEEPQQAQAAPQQANGEVTGRIDGIQGREVDLQEILQNGDDTTPSRFDIPDFLK